LLIRCAPAHPLVYAALLGCALLHWFARATCRAHRALRAWLCQALRHRTAWQRGFRIEPSRATACRGTPKPLWVKKEVLRLKALMSEAGCRTIEQFFNHLYAVRRRTTVSKSHVAYTVRNHRYEIEVLRQELKHRIPRALAKNALWAMDLTGKATLDGGVHAILGIEDHGTRRLLALAIPENKRAWTLLGHFFLAIGRFGKPRAIRTDNESTFRGALFRITLWFAGIRSQFTVPGCPWQNGRVERLFGTLKAKLDRIEVENRAALNDLLAEFGFFYNHVRPHQHLTGRTPEETWRRIDPYAAAPKSVQWFEAWGGLLQDYCLRH
jgi:transposase InsO family protein